MKVRKIRRPKKTRQLIDRLQDENWYLRGKLERAERERDDLLSRLRYKELESINEHLIKTMADMTLTNAFSVTR